MTASQHKWLKRIAVVSAVLGLLVYIPSAGIPFVGPRHDSLDKAGIWWYRSYNGNTWRNTHMYYRFRVSEKKFSALQRELHLRRTTDDISIFPRRSFAKGMGGLRWFNMKWNDDLELYFGDFRAFLCRDPHSGLCLMLVYN